MNTLIIRPYHQAQKVVTLLEEQGIPSHVQSTLEIQPLPYTLSSAGISAIQAVIVTSQNALLSIKDHQPFHIFPIYCVGKATAELAFSLGYLHIKSADGNASDLLALIQQSCSPQAGAMLHLTCPEAPFPFSDQLNLAGFQAQPLMVYTAQLASNLKEDVIHNLQTGFYENILFFSPRSAAHFVYLYQFHQLEDKFHALSAFCLSPPIAQAIKHVAWQHIFTASRPKLSTLLDLLCDAKKS